MAGIVLRLRPPTTLTPWDVRPDSLQWPYSPTNGQAEATTKVSLHGLYKKLDNDKGKWADELHEVLWSICTTEKNDYGGSPLMLTYGYEVVLLVKEPNHTHLLTTFQEALNNTAL